jgi:F-type H+-transporting ATPase subunit delta
MKALPKEAKGFVEGIVKYIKSDAKSPAAGAKVRSLLTKATKEDAQSNRAIVQSSTQLTAEEKKQIEQIVNKLTGRGVSFDYSVHPSLIAGVRVTVGDWILDTSLQGQLEDMKTKLVS